MPLLMLKDLPRYERLLEAAKQYPDLDPSACEVFMNLLRTGDEVFHLMHAHYHGHSISQGRFVVLLLLFDQLAGCSAAHTPAELAEKAGAAPMAKRMILMLLAMILLVGGILGYKLFGRYMMNKYHGGAETAGVAVSVTESGN
jgi:hypothetical protein